MSGKGHGGDRVGGDGSSSGRLRIAVVAEQLRRRVPGGIGRVATGLLGGLAGLDMAADLTIVAGPAIRRRGPDPLAAYPFPLQLVGGPLLFGLSRVGLFEELPDRIIMRLWERGRLCIRGNDVVHSVSLAAPPTGMAPLTVMVHDLAWRDVPEAYPRRGRAWHEAALLRAGRRAEGIVVPSATIARELIRCAIGVDASRIEVIPEGCDHLPAPDTAAAGHLLARLGMSGEFLLTVSTLEPRKNLRRLVEAYGKIRADLPRPWPLLVVGPVGWGPQLNASEGVVFAGRVEDPVLSALYAAARVAVYVPLAEGFGLPAVEALRAGAPLLASSAVPSIVEHESPAVLVDASSTAGIAQALGELATDDSRREQLARAGPESVRERTWDLAARRHLQWWAEVAS